MKKEEELFDPLNLLAEEMPQGEADAGLSDPGEKDASDIELLDLEAAGVCDDQQPGALGFDTGDMDLIDLNEADGSEDKLQDRSYREEEESEKEHKSLDWLLYATGALILTVVIVTVGFLFWSANRGGQDLSAIEEVGNKLAAIQTIGGKGFGAVADKQTEQPEPEPEVTPEITEAPPADDPPEREVVRVKVTFTSVEKDLKIKFINSRTNKLINSARFKVVLTSASGKELVLEDQDLNGIIYESGVTPGNYSVKVEAPEYYEIVSCDKKVNVRDVIVYQEVEVVDEIKTEEEVNVATEDTQMKVEIEQEVITGELADTVEWVESSRTTIGNEAGYAEIPKSSVSDPSLTAEAIVQAAVYSLMQTNMSVRSAAVGAMNKETDVSGTPDPTPTEGAAETPSPTPTEGAAETPSPTPTEGATETPSPTPSEGEAATPSPTPTEEVTETPSPTPTEGVTETPSPTPSEGATETPSPTPSEGAAETPSPAPSEKPEEETAKELKISKESLSLFADESDLALSAVLTMADGTKYTDNKHLTWESSDEKIIKVDQDGKLTPVAPGKATITVTAKETDAKDEELTASCAVTVKEITLSIKLNKETVTLFTEEKLTLTATVERNGKVLEAKDADKPVVTWSSSDESIAKVNAKTGEVTALKAGEVKITATTVDKDKNGKQLSAQCTVTVKTDPAKDKVSKLQDKQGNQVFVINGTGEYVEAVYADYFKADKFYIKSAVQYQYTGWQTFDNKTYYYDKNGNYVTGEQVIRGVKYTFGSDGVLSVGNAVLGIDVSRFNGEINWNAVKNAGVSFVIIRCGYRGSTQGALIEDAMFRRNIEGALSAGIRVGVYFFSQAVSEVEAVEEASMVLSLVQNYKISYPIFIDTEPSGGRADRISKEKRTAVCRAFCETIKNAGYRPGVYASKNWYLKSLNASELSAYTIWLAQYSTIPTYPGKYDMWQCTDKGTISGIKGDVDINYSFF